MRKNPGDCELTPENGRQQTSDSLRKDNQWLHDAERPPYAKPRPLGMARMGYKGEVRTLHLQHSIACVFFRLGM